MSWLSGWKTNAGAICLFLATGGEMAVVGIWAYNPGWMINMIETLKWAGAFLVPTGLGHKVAKNVVKKVANYDNNPPGIS